MNPFPLLKKGGTPTFLETTLANSVLRFLNGIIRAKITPDGAGKIVVGPDSIVIDLSATQPAVQAALLDTMSKQLASQQGQINAIISALKHATIAAVCNPADSTITVTITFPKLP